MFRRIGLLSARYPIPVLLGWVVILVVLIMTTPKLGDVVSSSQASYLPASTNSQQASRLLRLAFPKTPASSALVVLTGPLSARQHAVAALSAYALHRLSPAPSSVVSTALDPQLRRTLESADGAASTILLGWAQADTNSRPTQAVTHLRSYIASPAIASRYPGVTIKVTGDVAINMDYQAQINQSTNVTTIATTVLVLAIMLILFRSLVLPLVPLLTIGFSVLISMSVVAFLTTKGMIVSQNTPIFLIVLLAGAGTDYCLFLANRYKEELQKGAAPVEAVVTTITHVGAAIASSAAAVIVGIGGMAFAQFGLFTTTGPAVAVGVAITLALGLTLTPALLVLLGRRAFWPAQSSVATPSRFWAPLAQLVTRYPLVALGATLIVLLPLNAAVLKTNQSFNFITDLKPTVEAHAGFATMQAHFGVGNTAPQTLVVVSSHSWRNAADLARLDTLSGTLARLPDVASVQGPTRPSGQPIPYQAYAINPQVAAALDRNLSADGRTAQFTIVSTADPYSDRARTQVAAVEKAARAAFPDAVIHSDGVSAYTADTKSVIQDDLRRIALFVLGGIFLVLVLLLRSIVAPIYLVMTVIMSFGATLGLTTIVFQGLVGQSGLVFWVPILVLTFLIGLGIDYNILLMSRVREEAASGGSYRTAVAHAVERTGSIITSCGLILAGSFGTLLLGSVSGLQEIGFAVGVGILVDTFLIRSILVPSLVVLFGQLSWFPGRHRRGQIQAIEPQSWVLEGDSVA